MRKILAKGLLAVGVGAMVMLPQGCKRKAPAATPAAAPRTAPAPRFEPFPNDGAVDDTGGAPQPVRHRRRELPQTVQAPDPQETAAAAEAEQRKRDAALLQQQEAASQRQQQELNRMVQQSQKAQEEEQGDPRIQDAPGPAPGSRIQDAPGPAPGPRIQDAPGPSQPVAPPPQV
jgi:hypothetical protein